MKKGLIFFSIFIAIFFFVFRSLLLNLSTNLYDWYDYPLTAWLMFQNIQKIFALNFIGFFNTNAFYPNSNSLFFADTFIPQSIIGLPFYIFTKNPILVSNLIFVITFLLNYFSSYIFWRQIFKKDILAFLGSLFVVFSPFFYIESSHFQMLSYWPFFFTFYFLFKNEEKNIWKNIILAGIFLSIQFLASVYLAVFLMFSILLFYLSQLLFRNKKIEPLKHFLTIFAIFILIDGIFIKGYLDTQKTYNIHREPREYIQYSAQLSDYVFTNPIRSVIHQSKILQKWNYFDKNGSTKAAFPGFLLFTLVIFGLFNFKKNKELFKITLNVNKEKLFFLGLSFFGLLFSLGPRMSFNGKYVEIPLLPYYLLLKFVPFLNSVRAPVRWSFLFYFGLIYFSLAALFRINQKKIHFKLLIPVIVVIFTLEYLPINIQTHSESYINNQYEILKGLCSEKPQVLLEIPVTHMSAGKNIGEGLNYITKVELASVYHKCFLINGYSGYDLPSLFSLPNQLDKLVGQGDSYSFFELLKEKKATIVKLNKDLMDENLSKSYEKLLLKLSQEGKLEKLSDKLYKINY